MPGLLLRTAFLPVIAGICISEACLFGTEISGRVSQSDGKTVRISVDSELLPTPGDQFQIYFLIPGLEDPVPVAEGRAIEFDGEHIVARIEKASGKISKNQLVKFISTQPKSRKELMKERSTQGKPTSPIPRPDTPPMNTEIWFSDTFERRDGDVSLAQPGDLANGGNRLYRYLPIFPTRLANGPPAAGARIINGMLENNGHDFGGVQLTSSSNTRGADVGQDLYLKLDLFLPSDNAGHVTEGGVYFRSRAAASGDGVIGGRSAGYWVQLHSDGIVQVKCLNPLKMIADSHKPEKFDRKVFHQLEIVVRGNELQVALDDRPIEFNHLGEMTSVVAISSYWEGPPVIGDNQGTVGIIFSAEKNRGQIGGQRADNLVIGRYRPLNSK